MGFIDTHLEIFSRVPLKMGRSMVMVCYVIPTETSLRVGGKAGYFRERY